MPLTRLTASIIGSRDDIEVSAGGPCEPSGKWVGWITLGQEDRYRPLLNTEPIYNTKEEAVAAMQALVADIQAKIKEGCGDDDPFTHLLNKAVHGE